MEEDWNVERLLIELQKKPKNAYVLLEGCDGCVHTLNGITDDINKIVLRINREVWS